MLDVLSSTHPLVGAASVQEFVGQTTSNQPPNRVCSPMFLHYDGSTDSQIITVRHCSSLRIFNFTANVMMSASWRYLTVLFGGRGDKLCLTPAAAGRIRNNLI